MAVPMTPKQGANAASIARRGSNKKRPATRDDGIEGCRLKHLPHHVTRRRCRVKCSSTKPDEKQNNRMTPK
jgi:hypothetical protein